MEYVLNPIRWDVRYPVHVEPIGEIWVADGGYRAICALEDLGTFDTGDAAAEAVWERFLEQNRVRHEGASKTHGGYERHAK